MLGLQFRIPLEAWLLSVVSCQVVSATGHSFAQPSVNVCHLVCSRATVTLYTYHERGTAITHWLRCCATNRKVAGSIPAGASGFFIDIKSFRSHYDPGVDPASNRNEYIDYLLGLKAAGA